MREDFNKSPGYKQEYFEQIAAMETEQGDAALVSDAQFNRFLAFLSFIESRGANVVIVRAPDVVGRHWDAAFVAKYRTRCGNTPPFLDYGNSQAFPALYDPENRSDNGHLNAKGANIWSKMLADATTGIKANGEFISKGALGRCHVGGR